MQKVDNQTLTSEKGLSELTKSLDKILGKDDLEDCLTKYEDFEDYGRTTETIAEYIRVFETKYLKIENKCIKLPSAVLAFKLLRKASITGDDKKLCLTEMDVSEKDKLYDQAKKYLKKYCKDGNFTSSSTSGETVKLEQEVFAVGGRAGFYDNASQRDRGTSGDRFWPSHRPFRTNSESRRWEAGSGRGRDISERPLNP